MAKQIFVKTITLDIETSDTIANVRYPSRSTT